MMENYVIQQHQVAGQPAFSHRLNTIDCLAFMLVCLLGWLASFEILLHFDVSDRLMTDQLQLS